MKMNELVRVTLQNEMDLILAHKRSMRLGELTGLSLSAQTTFATAVSEVARGTIDHGKNGCLVLSISNLQRDNFIVAKIIDEKEPVQHDGLEYAKRLVDKYNVSTSGNETAIELYFNIPFVGRLNPETLDTWKSIFRNEAAVSPYEEIKRKNEQLQELTQKLKEREEQYKLLTNALPLIIFSINEKGELIYANEWLKRFTGATIAQLNDTRWQDVIHPDDYDAFSVLINPFNTAGASAVKTQCRLRHKTEEDYYWHLASVSPLRDDQGKILNWTGYIVDINAQKLIEETLKDNSELKEAQALLKRNQSALENYILELNRSNRELQEFAYVASHDLQEPARKMSYYSDFLLNKYETSLDPKGVEYLQNMRNASLRMRGLINDLLSFAQVERAALQPGKVNLNDAVSQVLQNLDMVVKEKGALVRTANLPAIEADENMIVQLLENIVHNALKYASDGVKPEIHITGHQVNGSVEIQVRDNGIGFDEKYLPQMFTLFQRLHSSTKYQGTGLGLAICKKIVALHNGTISAISAEGKGSTFVITLPINQPLEYAEERSVYSNG